MARYYDEDDRYPHHYHDTEDKDTEEEEDYEEEEYLEDEDNKLLEEDTDGLYYDDTIIPTEWKLLKMGDTRIRISNEGKIHYLDIHLFYVSSGLRETGTPYRFVQIEVAKGDIRKYYVHDLVWRAFHMEDPPEGWEVRHMNHVPMEENHCYSNHLQYLDIFRKEVCTEYEIAKII